jgi:hypothetical protein
MRYLLILLTLTACATAPEVVKDPKTGATIECVSKHKVLFWTVFTQSKCRAAP